MPSLTHCGDVSAEAHERAMQRMIQAGVAAAKGRGLVLVPTFIAIKELNDGSLRRVLSEFHAPPLHLYATYHPTRHLAVKVRLFVDFLVERFGGEPTSPNLEQTHKKRAKRTMSTP